MKILVISDIHANFTALEAVIKHAGPAEEIWCLGDLVGYGSDPNECVDFIRSLTNARVILGNHDAAALGKLSLDTFNLEARQSALWVKKELSEENKNWLNNLPQTIITENTTLAHGSPRNPVWEYMLDLDTAESNLPYFSTPYCLVGHTHVPIGFFVEGTDINGKIVLPEQPIRLNGRAIINPGSVGQPRDHDPRASYAIFKPKEKIWQIFRAEYNVAESQKRIIDAGLPFSHAKRLSEGW